MTHTSYHIGWGWLAVAFAAGCLLLLGSVSAEEGGGSSGITINSASWSSYNQRLSVSGSNAGRYATVTLTYPGDNAPIGTTQASRRGSWSANFYNLNPPPCNVRASNGSSSATRSVSNAPGNCSDNGGATNTPPVADVGGPYTGTVGAPVTFDGSGSTDPGGSIVSYAWDFGDGNTGSGVSPTHTYTAAKTYIVTLMVTDNGSLTNSATTTATITQAGGGGGGGSVTSRGDAYATPVGTQLNVAASRVSGVLYNDFGGTGALTAQLVSGPAHASSFNLNSDGSFSYTPDSTLSDNDNDSFTYQAQDSQGQLSDVATVNLHITSKQIDFKILMNYELGMHCTGFEFAYCCVLPPYNSILAQVVKPQNTSLQSSADFPRLLEGDPINGVDGLGRPTVLRDYDSSGNFKKYYLEYYHDAQPRREGQGKPQTSTLISDAEGNSLFYTSTIYDSAEVDTNNALVTGQYEGAYGVVKGNGNFSDVTDNYANGWLNHFYIYSNLEGALNGSCVDPSTNPATVTSTRCTSDTQCDTGQYCDLSPEQDKIRLGVAGEIEYPANVGAALQPVGPNSSTPVPFDNVLTFSGDTGTVVYTQAKVLENLPIMLTSPKIWEALGLPLTPFEDSIDFFGDPGAVDEDSVRPFVAMKAALHVANCNTTTHVCSEGAAVIGSNGKPVIGFGTAPIDIPNCERCHSVPATTPAGCVVGVDSPCVANTNVPSYIRNDFGQDSNKPYYGTTLEAITDEEKNFWDAYYNIVPEVDSDWYSRLKGAAINMMALHDFDNGTGFTANWPASTDTNPQTNPMAQNTRLGKESVICQKCHADNVIAVVKSAYKDSGKTQLIEPITEAIHRRHRETDECDDPKDPSTCGSINFADAAGRSGGCQGCHPAHRSDGVMDNYPITRQGNNAQAGSDNRLAAGGCFVGRDVHSNPLKDVDGAETPAHLNAVGQWLSDNVFNNQGGVAGVSGSPTRGLWCTNCHTQLSQEIWKAENCPDLIDGNCLPNGPNGSTGDIRGATSLGDLVSRINGVLQTTYTTQDAINWLDSKDPSVVQPPGVNVPAVTADLTHAIWDPANIDASVAIIETRGGNPYGTTDADGDFSVRILNWCTTADCLAAAQAVLDAEGNGGVAVAVLFSAATDARDHWLAAGEPHCADCHAAPYVEPSGGNIGDATILGETEFKPPFNFPHKASLMRYSKGHQGVTCQGCHESIHGLYPVTPTIDATSYAQAAALNADGSHGPLKCGTCHQVGSDGRPSWIRNSGYFGGSSFDGAVGWSHTYTEDASMRTTVCRNCHSDEWGEVSDHQSEYLKHADLGRVSRAVMDKVEIEKTGAVFGATNPRTTVCTGCHGDSWNNVSCSSTKWKQHLTRGRVAQSVWEDVTSSVTGTTCGW